MSKLIITRADEVVKTLGQKKVAAVLSIEHPSALPGKGGAPRLDGTPQLILSFWDSEQEVKDGPDFKQVEAGVEFVMKQLEKGDVLIHCHAGKSRSTAIALGVLALQHPDMSADALIEELLEIRPQAAPNILVVEMVDKIAGRGGKLTEAMLKHPVISAQRAQAESNRQDLLYKNPQLLEKMYPEKNIKPPKP